MDSKFISLTPDLYRYVTRHCSGQDPLLAELVEETATLGPKAMMQISPEQGALMTLLVRVMAARRILEIGTFTGYSSICLARGLAADGYLLSCDVNEAWTSIARRFWSRAGLSGKIELRLGPAVETLRSLPSSGAFDLAFIDADKPNYMTYVEECIRLVRPNGMILVDNVLWGGLVADSRDQSESSIALREVNSFLAHDPRVDVVMLPIADGLSLVRRK